MRIHRLTAFSIRAALATLALTLSLPACAQTAPGAKPAAGGDADPALWVVKDKDTTVYLFGTIHVLKPGLSWFDEAVKGAFDRSDEVALEIVSPDPATMRGLVQSTGIAAPGTPPLTERLSPDKRTAFTKAVTDLGLSADALDRYKPWLAATTLSIAPLSKLGYAQDKGPEEVITLAAKAENKPVIGLETAAQQLGYFSSLSDSAQMQFLASTLDELPDVGSMMDEMVDDWAQGKPENLAELLNDDLKDSPEVAKVLLVDRNKRWAQWIKQRMARPGTLFIAVGAGHLAGPDSVQAQLAKLGVRSSRITY